MLVNLTSESINSCDVVFVVPRDVGEEEQCTIWMGGGAQLLSTLTPDEACEEIGETLFTAPVVVTGFASPVRIAGRKVSRVRPTADGLGSVLMFGNTGTMFTAPAVTMASMLTALNACAGCDDGGGGASLAGALEWDPTPTSSNATGLAVGHSSAMYAGFPEGDETVVTVSVGVQGTCTTTGAVALVIPLPAGFPCDGVTAGIPQGDDGGGGLNSEAAAIANGADLTITFEGTTATGFGMWCVLQYTSGAEEDEIGGDDSDVLRLVERTLDEHDAEAAEQLLRELADGPTDPSVGDGE